MDNCVTMTLDFETGKKKKKVVEFSDLSFKTTAVSGFNAWSLFLQIPKLSFVLVYLSFIQRTFKVYIKD